MNPDLPADIFSCCLTTPIEIALRWFISENPLVKNITNDMIMKIPGRLNDRRTPLGELNWIFTAITDTIAWNSLPHTLFQKLFRQDLMVAALFRNFLLAERIMRHFGCHPMSNPSLPSTYQHPMWQAWDLAVDVCLTQLPALLAAEETRSGYEYKHSTFFAEQLTAFEVGLSRVGISKKPPGQLPIVLQVLLSQVHRLRALMLLSRFLDLGPWAVSHALSVGIFPYVLKLLQSPAAELKPVLVFIWCKILAVDRSCQGDLLKDNGFTYFIGILALENQVALPNIANMSEHRAMCAFILSVFCRGFKAGQLACLKADLLPSILPHLLDHDPLLRQWCLLCLASFWDKNVDVKSVVVHESIHEAILPLLMDPVPEVRAAALSALATLLGDLEKTEQDVNFEQSLAIACLECALDASPIVRKELVVTLSRFVAEFPTKLVTAASELCDEERRQNVSTMDDRQNRPDQGQAAEANATVSGWSDFSSRGKGASILNSIYGVVWKALLVLSVDSFPEVAAVACMVVDKIMMRTIIQPEGSISSLGIQGLAITNKSPPAPSQLPTMPPASRPTTGTSLQNLDSEPKTRSTRSSIDAAQDTTMDRISKTLRRSASLALMFLAGGSSSPSGSQSPRDSSLSLGDRSNPSRTRARPRSLLVSNLETTQEIKQETRSREDLDYQSEKDRLGLRSSLFDWSCEYFTEPQMKVPEIDDPGTPRYNERLWRHGRNVKAVAESSNYGPVEGTFVLTHFLDIRAVDEPLSVFHDELHPPIKIAFHQYDPHLLTADPFSRIWYYPRALLIPSVYDWESQTKVNAFVNPNPYGSRISALRFINEEDVSLMLVASDEGMIRLYRDYDSPNVSLVSAWKGLLDYASPIPPRGKGIVLDWYQPSGSLIVSGHSKMMRIWDAEREMSIYVCFS